MGKYNSNRNFGYGKQMSYAGKNSLKESYGDKFGTVAAHAARWSQACDYFKGEEGIRDVKDITVDTLEKYGEVLAEKVAEGEIQVSYAQNLLSTCNVTLSCLRGDDEIKVSPSSLVGERDNVRTEAPAGLDRESVQAAADQLREAGHDRTASILEIARDLGLRLREASQLNCAKALQQAEKTGIIKVTEGTKGGRGKYIAREVPVSERGLTSLRTAASVQGRGNNLIPANSNRSQFLSSVHNQWRQVRTQFGLRRIHDLRSAYACSRYKEITGKHAPAVAGARQADKSTDKNARVVIAQELGHGRTDVTSSYLGSAR